MKRFMTLLVAVPLLGACGSSNGTEATPPSAEPTQEVEAPAVPTADPAQYTEAHELAAKLGCPKVLATQGGGLKATGVEADCKVPTVGNDLFTDYDYDINVFPDPQQALTYIQTVRGAYNPKGLTDGRWVVLTSGDDEAVTQAQTKIGGQQL